MIVDDLSQQTKTEIYLNLIIFNFEAEIFVTFILTNSSKNLCEKWGKGQTETEIYISKNRITFSPATSHKRRKKKQI